MRLRHLLLSLLLVLAFSAGARGQCFNPSFTMTKSVYFTTPTGQTPPTAVYYSITLAGTSGTNPSCPMGTNALHHSRAYNVLAGVGGWVDGANVCKTCYMTVTNTQSVTGQYLADQDQVSVTISGNAVCTVAGTFFSYGTISDVFGFKYTKVQTISQLDTSLWAVGYYCTAVSRSPDYQPVQVGGPSIHYSWFKTAGLCERVGPGYAWHCYNPGAAYDTQNSAPEDCTNTDQTIQGSFDWFDWVHTWFARF